MKVRIACSLAAALIGIGILSSCQSNRVAPSAGRSVDADIAGIMEFNRASLKALNDGNIDALNALAADEYTMILANRPAVSGRANIEAGNRSFLTQWRDVETWTPDETVVSGDWGFQRGTFEMTLTSRKDSGQQPRHLAGNYLHIYHRQADGSWKLARAMNN